MKTSSPLLDAARGSTPVDAPSPTLVARLAERLSQARPILVVSPPRSVSTAFARALSEHSSVNRCFHEPCGLYRYENTSLVTVLDKLDGLAPGAVIKEMTFQFRELTVAECFFRHCASPTIFLARSPLLTIESRIRMVLTDLVQAPSTPEFRSRASGASPDVALARAAIEAKDYTEVDSLLTEEAFPIYRTGWTDFAEQLELCRKLDLDYVVVEATRFRNEPEATLAALCPRLGLSFEPDMLHWDTRDALPPGALNRHSTWYARVDASTGVQPPVEHIPPLERFPARFLSHLNEALATYERAITDPRCL